VLQEIALEKWNQTTITWPMWEKHVSGESLPAGGVPIKFNLKAGSPRIYNCVQISARSQRSRQVRLALSFNQVDEGQTSLLDEIRRQALERHLLSFVRGVKGSFSEDRGSREDIVVEFYLQNKEEFCERTIDLVGTLFKSLGIEDKHKRLRGNFEIAQVTHVREMTEWIRFDEWLRKKFRLQGPEIYFWTN
jgi:hypothetical protein